MSTQNLQSAESRKINKSFFEGQSLSEVSHSGPFECRRESEEGGGISRSAPITSPPSSLSLPPYLCHRLDSLISFGYTNTNNTQNIKSEV